MSDSAPSVPRQPPFAVRPPFPEVAEGSWLAALIAEARSTDGQPPFSDGALLEYRQGERELVAIGEDAAALVKSSSTDPSTSSGNGETRSANGESSSGNGVTGNGIAEAEFVVSPATRGNGLGTQLLERLLAASPTGLLVWAHGDHPAARALAASHGLEPTRTLLHLAAELPPVDVAPELDARIERFVTGRDEQEWVDLNALIFVDHEEQGSVSVADVRELETESWFTDENFLLLRDDAGVMIGFCWLKVEGERGEFYVVGIHPEPRGEGLGGLLFAAGLDRLRQLGIRFSHLYVEGDNTAALALYRSRGFDTDSIDIQYRSSTLR
jgi:mycothiol synthase